MSNTTLSPTTINRAIGEILHNNMQFCSTINRQLTN